MSARETLLYLDGITVSFDGCRALNNLSLVFAAGWMRAVIGPNGAGKTTMMDVITGRTRPDRGVATFRGSHDLTRLDEPSVAALGIGRKFQKPTVFETQTDEDNLLLALAGERRARLDGIVETVHLAPLRHRLAGSLSQGQKQWFEIGMLLAQDPALLLVEEPVAGMTDAETEETARLLVEINRNHSVIVVEHDWSSSARLA